MTDQPAGDLRTFSVPDVFVATSTALPMELPQSGDRPARGREAWLLRDLDLASLVRIAASRRPTLAVDMDTIEGLNADAAAVRFVVGQLGVEYVVSRRPALAVQAASLGAFGLAHLFAFDSTGLRRSLEGFGSDAGIGVVVSPGLVVRYLTAADLRRLPKPLVAYGLIERPEHALGLLEVADSVVLRPELLQPVRAMQRELTLQGHSEAHLRRALDMPAETI